VEPLVEHREDDRLREADNEQAHTARQDDLLQRGCPKDVASAGENLSDEVVLLALESRLGRAQEQQRDHDGDEARGVEHRNGAASCRGVDPGADERGDEP